MSGVRPADYPPPFSSAEAIGAPTDPPDERIEVGVLIVGGGPGGLACAVRLGQLLEEHPDLRQTLGEVPVAVLEKGKQPGSHLLSGAVMNPRAIRRLFAGPDPDRGDADLRAGARRGRLSPHQGSGSAHPAAADDAQPRQLDRLDLRARALPRRPGRGGGRDDPPRDRRPEAAPRPRSGRGRADGRQGPGQGGRAAAELRARGGHHREDHRPRGGHGRPPDDRRDRPFRPSGSQPADLGARCQRGLEGRAAAPPDRPHDGMASAQERPLRGVRRILDLPDGGRARLDRVRRRARVRRRRALGAGPPPGVQDAPARSQDPGRRGARGVGRQDDHGGRAQLGARKARRGRPHARRGERGACQRAAPQGRALRDRVRPARRRDGVRGAPARRGRGTAAAPSTGTTPPSARATSGRSSPRCGTCARRSTRASSWAAPSRAR